MAVTAHSDPYAIFLRKIGYSVGLEFTAERVDGLVAQYLRDRDLTVGGWNKLVTGKKEDGNWGRDKGAERHIADFLHSLRLIQRTADDVLVLENLDAMAIATSMLESKSEQDAARNFLLLWSILVNDGEIFVNLLLAGFQKERIKDTLRGMIFQKRDDLLKHMAGKASAARVHRVITIEHQEKNRGSAGMNRSVSSLRRTEPLQVNRGSKRTASENEKLEFSSDYFRKVPPRRRDWASSLGLWDSEQGLLTRLGQEFIDKLRASGYIDVHDRFTYWPMDYELVRSGFRPDLLGDCTRDLWTCLIDFGNAYADIRVKSSTEDSTDSTLSLIGDMMNEFQGLHVRKAMLRRELPITIAYPVAVALACATVTSVTNLPETVAREQKGAERRLAFRKSRNTGGTLSAKK